MEKKKSNWWVAGGIIAIGVLSAMGSLDSSTQTQPLETVSVPTVVETQGRLSNKEIPPVIVPAAEQKEIETPSSPANNQKSSSGGLSNDNYYTNVDGDTIHSPAKSIDGGVPSGASARCRDGTYSFSANRRGTCSHHGGVATWF